MTRSGSSQTSLSRCQRSEHGSIAITNPRNSSKPGSGDVTEETGAKLARYYDLDVASETPDIAMYQALASASDGPVLELACGTGRICVPLAVARNRVTGVDRDPFMLERARRAWETASRQAAPRATGTLDLVEADMTNVRLRRRFDLVIVAFNSLLLLPDERQRGAALTTIGDHLSANGRAVIDVWLPTADDLELYDGRLVGDWQRTDPETGAMVTKTTRASYKPDKRRAMVETTYETTLDGQAQHAIARTDEIQFVGADTLLAEMDANGLAPQSLFGGYDMTDFAPDSERLIVLSAPHRRT